jgi:pimeloyl-ACP methyl ester carboxylesterase
MTTYAVTTASKDTHLDAYRRAERALWGHYGLRPRERFIESATARGRIRVLDTGSGDPVLFVHGTVGLGAWASLIRELPEMRSIVVERPGWGLSSPIDYSTVDYGACSAGVLGDVLDGLGLESAHVVGGSIGNVWALRLAERHPSRVRRVVLTGGGAIVQQAGVPRPIKLIASPLGGLMIRLSRKPETVRKILRSSGHGPSLDDGRIPDVFVEWRAAVGRETSSMRHERDMVRAIVGKHGYRPDLTFTEEELRAIEKPVLHVLGTEDAVGSPELWQEVSGLIRTGTLELVEGAGHTPWFDDVHAVAASIRGFLAADPS